MKYSERFYRELGDSSRWKTFRIKIESTDLFIRARSNLSDISKLIVTKLREEINKHILRQPEFLTSFEPIIKLNECSAIINKMYVASEAAGVGPMAGVAGAIAEFLGIELLNYSNELIIENGGDIWLNLKEPAYLSIFAGRSPFTGKIVLRVDAKEHPMGICTSSGTVGHSFSFGNADAVTIISSDVTLADAVATQTGNLVDCEEKMNSALDFAMGIHGVTGALIIYRDKLSIQGEIELTDPCMV